MATFDYNPITGQLDLVGGGASYIDGVVADSSLLPVTLGTPALDAVYLAKVGSGVWLLNRKPAGLYVRVANNGVAADWTYLGAFPEVNADGNWELYNTADPTKELKFNLASISTGQTRTLTVPNASGRIQIEGQAIGNVTAAAGSFTTLSATGIVTGSNATTSPPTTIDQAKGLQFSSLGGTFGSTAGIYGSHTGTSTLGIGIANGSAGILTQVAAFTSTGLAVTGGLTATTSLTLGTSGILSGGTNLIEQVNSTNAQTFRIYRTFTDASNYDRGFLRWSGTTLQIGTERLGSAGNLDLHLLRGSDAFVRLATNGLNVDTVLTVKSTFGPIINGGAIQLQTSQGEFPAILARDAADILAMRNGTNAQTFRIYNTFTSTTNFERLNIIAQSAGSVIIGTEKGSAGGTARALEFQTDGVTRMTMGTTGNVSVGTSSATYRLNVSASANASYVGLLENTGSGGSWRGGLLMMFPNVAAGGNGALFFGGKELSTRNGFGINYNHVNDGSTSNYIGFSFFGADNLLNVIANGLISIGGTTSSFPALKQSSATLQVRLADDSAYSVLDAQLRSQGTAPATAGATGTAGDIRYDADYIYVATATNTWKRAAIATW